MNSPLALLLLAALAAEPADPATHFNRVVAPLLAARCLDCHSGAEPSGGLDLSRRQRALAGGDSGAAIAPGRPDESLLWDLVRLDEMPPKKPLSAAEKEVLNAWLAAGASWGDDPIDPYRYTTEHRAGRDWWSLQPPARPPAPAVADAAWVRTPIDAIVLAKLAAHDLTPSAPAEPRVLVRRLYFDLHGLPPDPAVVERFAADPSEAAYRRLVDELLAAPEFGERWARPWLDLVRWAESDGFERNAARPHAWPYRDWVIDALNSDLPYDEFLRQQIAGDLLAPSDAAAVAATGFLVAGVHNTVVANNPVAQQQARHEELEDIIGVVAQSFLGLTVQCARCHDHKFDPVTQHDYYALVAALDGVGFGERQVEDPRGRAQASALDRRLADLEAQLAELLRRGARQALGEPAPGGRVLPTSPLARWSFTTDARDALGALHGELQGGATVRDGRLWLDGVEAFVVTAPLRTPLRAKTLEAWVRLARLDQGGGGVLAVERTSGSPFDALVFGERRPRQWLAGSNNFRRTRDVAGAADESAAPDEPVHVALVHHADGRIALFRNGAPYGAPYRPDGPESDTPEYPAGEAHVLLGKRHTGGGRAFLAGAIDEARLYDRALSAAEVAASFAAGADAGLVSEEAALAALSPQQQAEYRRLLAEHEQAAAARGRLDPRRTVFAVAPRRPPPTHLLVRGDVRSPAEPVTAAGVASVGAGASFALTNQASDAERRRRLADWLASPENPLTARVAVNRLWAQLFGVGLVDTPSDFGFSGGRPSHPELLDWLAVELVERSWRRKEIVRLIVTSSVYRQAGRWRSEAAAVDADNRLLWRRSPRRLEAEAVRDAMLVVAGALHAQRGGPGYHDVRTYHNSGTTYYEPLEVDTPEARRRTIYRFSPRGERPTLLDALDCPDPSVATPRRTTTTTPLQALALLNSSFSLRMSERLAERVRGDTGGNDTGGNNAAANDAAAVDRAFQLALARTPNDDERIAAATLVRRHGLVALARALLASSEFLVVE